MQRRLEPEILDEMSPTDPLAIQSRADLRRLNAIMGHVRHMDAAFRSHVPQASGPVHLRICELGAGDGSLMLALARRWSERGVTAEVQLLDRQPVITQAECDAFTDFGWTASSIKADVFDWLATPSASVDLIVTNLFLHHFNDGRLCALLHGAATRTRVFIACEPRRSPGSLLASRLVGLIGCNTVTRNDAVISVRAGFQARELSALWPQDVGRTEEGRVGLFSHRFVGIRDA